MSPASVPSARGFVPPGAVATLARAQRKVYLGLLTLVMSIFETSDKLVIGVFALSTTLVMLFWFLTKAVATGDPAWVAALVVVAVAAICCGPVMSRMIRAIEAVDAIADEFDAASKKLLGPRRGAARARVLAPAAAPRQPSRELRGTTSARAPPRPLRGHPRGRVAHGQAGDGGARSAGRASNT